MKVSHVVYKVNNLHKAVKDWTENGFTVEYGKTEDPYNAIIYFSEGPYIELFGNSGMSFDEKAVLRREGMGKVVDRMEKMENSEEGLVDVVMENYEENLNKELSILKKHNVDYYLTPSQRLDTKGRDLRFSVAFPLEDKIPFFMTYFNIDPKPVDYVHANGVKSISSISFGTTQAFMPLINLLCDDPILKLFDGEGVKNLVYEYVEK